MSFRRRNDPPDSWLAIVRPLISENRRDEVVGDLIELWRLRAAAGERLRGPKFWRDAWSLMFHGPQAFDFGFEKANTMDTLFSDVRSAVRGLRSSKSTTLLAFFILATTIAAGTVTFSVVDAVAIRPLPFGGSGELVSAGRKDTTSADPEPVAPQDYYFWRGRVQSLSSLGAAAGGPSLRFESGGSSKAASVARTTTNLFEVLGVQPALGRFFRTGEDTAGNDGVMVLSHAFWRARLGADPSVIGRRLGLDRPREIIGVLPPDVVFPVSPSWVPEVFVPYVPTPDAMDPGSGMRTFSMHVVGRLRPGVQLTQARAELEQLSAAMIAEFPSATERDRALVVSSLQDRVLGSAKRWLYLVLASVGVVLLIACVNVANLFLARAAVRVREFATRQALGASRARLVRVLLIEGGLLAVASAAAGIAVSYWGVSLATASLPASLARTDSIVVDLRVIAVSVAAALTCGLVFAGAPAWWVSRGNTAMSMRVGNNGSIGGAGRLRSLKALLGAQTAFVSVLLFAGVLLVTSFIRISTADLGFDRSNVVSFGLQKSLRDLPEADRPAAARVFRSDLIERARAVPGVSAAGFIENGVPLLGGSTRYSMTIPGYGAADGKDMFETREVTPAYFDAIGLRLVRGRRLTEADTASTPLVAVINEEAARRFFAGRDPIGQVLTFRGPTTIVGIVQSVRLNGPEVDLQPEIYLPIDQGSIPSPFAVGALVVRTNGPSASIALGVRDAIRSSLGGSSAREPMDLEAAYRRLTADRRFNAGVMTIFATVALLIGAIGIYGTMAFLVTQRVREIGLRMALGASPALVLRSVLRDAGRCVAAGLVVGLAGAWMASGLFTTLVFGIAPTSPSAFAAVAGILAVVGALAAFLPARRAAHLDPLRALKAE